jgi:hypothetical protein
LERNSQQKYRFPSGINCLIRLAAFVQEKIPGRRPVTGAQVDTFRADFVRSTHQACFSTTERAPHTKVHKILQKCLKFISYKYQLLQHVTVQNKEFRYTFCSDLLSRLEDEYFTAKIVLIDEATFHLTGNVNRHNLRIWGSNNPVVVIEHTKDSPKL